eukprot:scaffold241215_cov32-Tisochrysis_lutea.AAC.1
MSHVLPLLVRREEFIWHLAPRPTVLAERTSPPGLLLVFRRVFRPHFMKHVTMLTNWRGP